MATLREYLFRHNIKQVDFAKKIGRTNVAVSNYVRGIYVPDTETMRRIADATGGEVTPNDFLLTQPTESNESNECLQNQS